MVTNVALAKLCALLSAHSSFNTLVTKLMVQRLIKNVIDYSQALQSYFLVYPWEKLTDDYVWEQRR